MMDGGAMPRVEACPAHTTRAVVVDAPLNGGSTSPVYHGTLEAHEFGHEFDHRNKQGKWKP